MVNFRTMNYLIRKVGRMSKLTEAKQTRNDEETMGIFSSVVDDLMKMQEELRPMMETLENPEERMIINLRYLKGHGYAWIADNMHINVRTVYLYLKNARMALIERFPDRVEME